MDLLLDTDVFKMLINFSHTLKPVVSLLKDPKMCSPEMILELGLKSVGVLRLINSNDLTRLLFDAISR